MTEVKQSELQAFHEQWKRDAITRQVVKLLDDHINNLTDTLADKSMDTVNMTDQQFRQLAVQLKTTKTIKKLIHDTPTFVSKLGQS